MLAVFALGQKQKEEPVSPNGVNGSGTQSASGSGAVLDSGTRIEGQLQSTVDVKKSKVGDEVVLKTTKSIKQNGQTVVPKGSRLIGRITEVQEKTKSNGASKLGIIFDRLEGQDIAVPISASIVSITNVMASKRISDPADSDLFVSSNSSARASGGGSSGGGLLGGVSTTAGGLVNTGGGLLNTTTQTVGSVTSSVGQTVDSTGGSVIKTVSGIAISNSVSGSVQSGSTLSAANKNIKLEKGVIVGLQLNGSIWSQ